MDYLAQQGQVMFERNIAIIASRKQEVQIFSDSFVYEGFVCGLDNDWLQIYGHEEGNKDNFDTRWRFLLIGKDKISAVGPTGRSIHDLDDETREWVSKKIENFSGVADKFMSVRNAKNGKENR
jgi:hypothetical protein